MKLFALGPKGTNGHEAAIEVLNRIDSVHISLCGSVRPEIDLCGSHASVFERLHDEDNCYAIVPIENSIEGPVADTIRGFWLTPSAEKSGVSILAEVSLPIEHELVVRPGIRLVADTPVMSHPQALGQCRKNLQRFHLSNLIPTKSTAGAGKLVAESVEHANSAALVSPFAARTYGLEVVQHHMEDVAGNVTRFHLLGRDTLYAAAGYRTAAILWTKNRPGALWMALGPIAKCGVNMTSIHSLPLGRPGEFAFYVEFDEAVGTQRGKEIWARLKKATDRILWLGSFPQERIVLERKVSA